MCLRIKLIAECKNRTLTATADNIVWIYIDGQQVGYNDNYQVAITVTIPNTAIAVAAQVFDSGSWGGLLGSFSDGHVTDSSWKCTQIHSDGWNGSTFNDSTWPAAMATMKNGDLPWGIATNISSTAKWIWTGSYNSPMGTYTTVYCRKQLGLSSLSLYKYVLNLKFSSSMYQKVYSLVLSSLKPIFLFSHIANTDLLHSCSFVNL